MAAVVSGQKAPVTFSKWCTNGFEASTAERANGGRMTVQRHRVEAWALDGCGRAASVYVAALLVVAIIFVAKINARNRMRNS